MKVKPPQLRPVGQPGPDAFQREVVEEFRKLSREPLLDNNVVENVVIGTSNTSVAHGLSRTPVGWELVDIRDNAVVWRISWDSNTAVLRASASVTVSIRFH